MLNPLESAEGILVTAAIRDISAARAMALQMTHSAEHDFLTGLPNRMLVNDRISQAIAFARRHVKKVAVLFLDLDGFKHINDSLGHRIGDKLLQSTAERLVGCVRTSDTVSRQGAMNSSCFFQKWSSRKTPPSRQEECCGRSRRRIPSTNTIFM
jgi:predicted signal transduction protein with EAL and GGDEF domain